MKPYLLLTALVLATVSCEQTREQRIAQNAATFSGFPQADQDLIKKGGIRVGMSKDAVSLSLGKPDEKAEIISSSGKPKEIWTYFGFKQYYSSPLYVGVGPYDRYGRGAYYDYGPVVTLAPYARFRITFTDGLVSTWQQQRAPL